MWVALRTLSEVLFVSHAVCGGRCQPLFEVLVSWSIHDLRVRSLAEISNSSSVSFVDIVFMISFCFM